MLIAILSAAICLIIAIILFTPTFRHLPLFRPVALFFIFEGVWIMADYLFTQLFPGTEAMQWVHYAGVLVFGGYLAICLFFSKPKKPKNEKNSKRSKRKKQRSNRVGLNNRV
ncbi:MAG: hypothetical protein U0O22_00615 [Acutalibacteraceae bacterium]